MSNSDGAKRAALTAVVATGLAMFPRHALIAIAIAVALSTALSRRAAVLVLCALLIGGVFGLRADGSRRTHTPTTHPHDARHH